MVQLLFSSFVSYISHRERFAVFAGKLAISFTNWNTSLKSEGFKNGKKNLIFQTSFFQSKMKVQRKIFPNVKMPYSSIPFIWNRNGWDFFSAISFVRGTWHRIFSFFFFIIVVLWCCIAFFDYQCMSSKRKNAKLAQS